MIFFKKCICVFKVYKYPKIRTVIDFQNVKIYIVMIIF